MLDGRKVLHEDDYFMNMVIPPWNESVDVLAISALKEPCVLGKTVSQWFYIKDPFKPSSVVYQTGNKSIIGMDEVNDNEDYEQLDDYPAEE